MGQLLVVTATLSWASLALILGTLQRATRGTSLARLWRLALGVWLLWGVAAGGTLSGRWPAGVTDMLWYSVAISMLLPPVAVLGARRPIDRVWPWFVLLPLALVFSWPVLSGLADGSPVTAWSLEEPLLVGYALVMVMGAGNYLGLRQTLSALLWIAGLVLLIGPLCPLTAGAFPAMGVSAAWSAIVVAAALWIAVWLARRAPPPSTGGPCQRIDRLWLDFRDLYGVVWARRVQERFNDELRRRRLAATLTLQGLELTAGLPVVTEESTRETLRGAEFSLRWLLQKFVDPQWIDARLGPDPDAGDEVQIPPGG